MAIHLTKEGLLRTGSEEGGNTDTELVTSWEEWRRTASVRPLKRLVDLWNALPSVPPVRKFTSREIALKRIWRFVHPSEQTTARKAKEPKNPFRDGSKAAQVYALLCRPEGATAHQIQQVTGWQRHSVRGFLSAGFRNTHGAIQDGS